MTRPAAARALVGVAAFLLIVAGVSLIYLPAGFVVAGVLILIELRT